MKKILLSVALGLIVTACASAPSEEQMRGADYGVNLTPQECEAAAKDYVLLRLKDPGSATFRFDNACQKGYVSAAPLFGREAKFGWQQVGFVNAKNSLGGYTGFSKFMALIKDKKVVSFCFVSRSGHCFPE